MLKDLKFFSSSSSSNDFLLSCLCVQVAFLSFLPIYYHGPYGLDTVSTLPQKTITIWGSLDSSDYAIFPYIVFPTYQGRTWQWKTISGVHTYQQEHVLNYPLNRSKVSSWAFYFLKLTLHAPILILVLDFLY